MGMFYDSHFRCRLEVVILRRRFLIVAYEDIFNRNRSSHINCVQRPPVVPSFRLALHDGTLALIMFANVASANSSFLHFSSASLQIFESFSCFCMVLSCESKVSNVDNTMIWEHPPAAR